MMVERRRKVLALERRADLASRLVGTTGRAALAGVGPVAAFFSAVSADCIGMLRFPTADGVDQAVSHFETFGTRFADI
jgi:hypothetical protein